MLRELRGRSSYVPILVLTARDGIDDRVNGLNAGADDYVVKPFAMKELAARLRALLRRPGQGLSTVLSVGNLQLHTVSRQVTVNGKNVHFSVREVEVIELLMRHEIRLLPEGLWKIVFLTRVKMSALIISSTYFTLAAPAWPYRSWLLHSYTLRHRVLAEGRYILSAQQVLSVFRREGLDAESAPK